MAEIETTIPVVDAEHPWLGLLSFTERTRKFFFGRDTEITEIIDRIQENTLTVLFGQSGLGKTSLLGAGVLPRLQEMGHSPVLVRLDHDPAGLSLLDQTRKALLGAIPGASLPADGADITLWELFHRKPLLLPDDLPAPVVLFDQFEEIFTLGDEEQASAWIEQVADLLQNRPPQSLEARFEENRRLARDYDFLRSPIRFVFSLREDYLYHLERWKTRLPLLVQNRMSLQLLNGQRALDAVIGPASLRPTPLVSAEVAGSIVRTVADVPPDTPLQQIKAVPPLLSLLCEQLNLARIAAGAETIDAAMVSEQSIDILQRFYEESFSAFPEDQRESIRRIVEDPPMVTEGGHRNSMVREDAEAILRAVGIPEPHKIFDALIHRRLLTAEEHAGLQRLEITHDVLVPLVVHSRKQRRDRQIESEKLAAEALARSEAMKRARLRALLAGSLVLLALSIIAGFFAFAQKALAEKSATKAADATKVAIASEERATSALADARRSEQMAKDALARQREEEAKQQALFRQASMSDQQAGVRASDAGNGPEALAHFERAIRYWPENSNVLERGLSELLTGKNSSTRHRFTETFNSGILRSIYSPDGKLLAACTGAGELKVLDPTTGKLLWQTMLADYPQALVFSPDGLKLATGGNDRIAQIFDAATGEKGFQQTFENYVLALDFSPDSRQLSVSSGDRMVRVFDLAESKLLWDRIAPELILALRYSPDGKQLALGTAKGELHMMDTVSGVRNWNTKCDGDINAVAFHPRNGRVAVGSSDKSVRTFDTANGGNPWRKDLTGSVTTVMFSNDGSHLAAGSDNSELFVSNVKTDTDWTFRCGNPVWGIDFSPDGSRIAVASSDSMLRVFRTDRPTLMWDEKFPHFVQCCAFSPDGDHVAAGSGDKTLRIFRESGNPPLFITQCEGSVSKAMFHPDGSRISFVSHDYLIRTVDPATGAELWRSRFEGSVTKLDIAPENNIIVASAEDMQVRAFAADGKILWQRTFGELIYSLAVNADASLTVIGLGDKSIECLDATGATKWTAKPEDGLIREILFDPSGQKIFGGSEYGSVFCYDLTGGKLWNAAIGGGVFALSRNPDGTTIAVGGKGRVFKVFDAATGAERWKMETTGQISGAEFSPDGKFLVIGGADNVIRYVNAADGSEVWSSGLSRSCNRFAFSPDGKRLAATCFDRSVRIFDSANGSEVWSTWFDDVLTNVALSPDGQRLIAGSSDSTLRGFDLPPPPSGQAEAELLRSLFILRGNAVFDEIGRVRAPSKKEKAEHLVKMRALAAEAHLSPFQRAILWESAPTAERMLSPASQVSLRKAATEYFVKATTLRMSETAAEFAPWHPLASLARVRFSDPSSSGPDRFNHLSRLTLNHLRRENPQHWESGTLVECHATAAAWMGELQQNLLAVETAKAGLGLDPDHFECLRLVIKLGSNPDKLQYGERVLLHPSATSFDWGTAAYNFSKVIPVDPKNIARSRELIAEVRKRYPGDHTASFYIGWALVNLDDLRGANEEFKEMFDILDRKKISAVRDQITGIVITAWLTGERDLALKHARQLAVIEPGFFKPGGLDNINWPAKEVAYFKNVVGGLLLRDPSLGKVTQPAAR